MVQVSPSIHNLSSLRKSLNSNDIGRQIYQMISRLYPICRSITGNGVRETLKIFKNTFL